MTSIPFIDPPPAVINGYAARALAVWLRAAWERGEFGSLPPDGREEVRRAVSAIVYAGEAWYRRRPSAIGSAEAVLAEVGATSTHDEHLTVDQAAGILGITPRRVRDLAASGLGRKIAGRWLLDPALVALEAERRAA